jgi:hypothetical protein
MQHGLHALVQRMAEGLRPPRPYFLGAPHGELHSPLENFAMWCAAHAGTSTHVLLSGELTHQYVLPLEGAQALYGQARSNFARRHFVQYYGDLAQSWPLDTWCNQRHHGACAIHGVELSALQNVVKQHRVRLQAVEPAWAWMLRWVSLRHPSWADAPSVGLVLVEGAFITWLLCSQGSVLQIQQRRLQCATLQDLTMRLQELKAQHAPTLPVWVGGYGLDGPGPCATDSFQALNALSSLQFPAELLT